MLDVNGWELIMLVVVGILVLGPERLPEYAGKLANMVRQVRNLATNARSQLKDQMGPEFEDVDWRQFDPRQYDPRRIVREALMDDPVDRGRHAWRSSTAFGALGVARPRASYPLDTRFRQSLRWLGRYVCTIRYVAPRPATRHTTRAADRALIDAARLSGSRPGRLPV